MIIVLDTNVIQEDFLMRSGRFAVLLDYATKSGSKFALTQLVFEELTANYRRELHSRFTKWIRSKEQLNGLLAQPSTLQLDLDIEASTAHYQEFVLEQLRLTRKDI